jgi:predicted permease
VRWLSRLVHDFRSVVARRREEREMEEELQAHLELLAEEKLGRGATPDEAWRAARVELGSVESVKEAVRDARFSRLAEDLWKDLGYAGRTLARAPGFTAVTVLTLALGIGATAAIFSVVHAVLIRPLPYADPGRLTLVWSDFTGMGARRAPASPFEFREIATRSTTLADLAGIWVGSGTLTGDGEPEQIKVGFCTPNFLDTLGARPLLGHSFLSLEPGRPASGAILLGYGLWQSRFGGRSDVVGHALRFEGRSATVAGVMPRGFHLAFPPDANVPADIQAWVPFTDDIYRAPRDMYYLRLLGRLKAGVGLDQAQADAARIAGQLRSEFAEFARDGLELEVVPLRRDAVRNARSPLLALLAGVGLLLLIACVNVANLLLARHGHRRKEIAIRAALGAGRGRLGRQLVAESLLLAGLGGLLGLGVGQWGLELLIRLRPAGLGLPDDVHVNLPVLGVVLAISVLTGVLFGLVPGLVSAKVDLKQALQESSRRSTAAGKARLRAALVVSEVALGFILLVGAGLMIRTLMALSHVDPGFHSAGVLTFEVNLPRVRYPGDAERRTFARAFSAQLAELPGVESEGAISHLPLDDFPNWYSPYAPAGVREAQSRGLLADHRTATAGYMRAMGAELVAGRLFDERDDERGQSVVIVDDLLAERSWPGESALGKRIHHEYYRDGSFPTRDAVVVGVIRHMRHHALQLQLREQIYIPYPQSPRPHLSFAVRTAGDPVALVAGVRGALRALDKDLALSKVRPMSWYVDRATLDCRFTTVLASVFGATAVVLALVGLFGLVSYSVGQREQEIGVRMALGARPADVLTMVVREGVALTAVGLGLGVACALYVTRFVQSQLYGVSHLDPATYLAAVVVLTLFAGLASWIPARRAARTSPVESLRS